MHEEEREHMGVAVVACADSWEVNIDCTLPEPTEWFLHLHTPLLYAYIQIDGPHIPSQLLEFLQNVAPTRRTFATEDEACLDRNHTCYEMVVGHYDTIPVIFRRDEESPDRYFLSVMRSSEAYLELTIQGDDIRTLTSILETLAQELDSHGDSAKN